MPANESEHRVKCRDGVTDCPEPELCDAGHKLCNVVAVFDIDLEPGVRGAIAQARVSLERAREKQDKPNRENAK